MIKKLKKNDFIFFILKNIQLFLKRSIKKLLVFSGEDERISKIENALISNHKKTEFLWEEMCLNGQKFRRKILEKFLKNSKFDLIVETGTEYGFTSFVTTAPAPTIEYFPIFVPHTIVALAPTEHPFSNTVFLNSSFRTTNALGFITFVNTQDGPKKTSSSTTRPS